MAITTANPEAQKFFDQGLAQLHSFWATEAERSFRQAAALDPEAPMPWWGVAMVSAGDYRPRFQIDTLNEVFGKKDPRTNPTRAKEAVEKALALSGKATDLERMYIAAVAARRLPSQQDADDAYIAGLRAIVAKYPQEIEARTFLALHLMRGYELPERTPRPGTMEAVEMLRQLMKDAPDHPGVHHYVIHGWEGSTFAKDAWPSCRRYAELVPNIPHALHMPGHIYSQTGKWAEAVQAFSDASVNELGYIKADPLYGTGHHGHNVHYLSTAYAFRGDYAKAKETAKSLLEFKENPREAGQIDSFFTAYRQGWFAMMRALVISESWEEILDGQTLPVYNKPREMAWRNWAIGVAHAGKGQTEEARADAKRMDAALEEYVRRVEHSVPPELTAARRELDGHILASAGKFKPALQKLEQASQMQRKLTYSEPPRYPRPVAEVLGQVAMKAGKRSQAEAAFRKALEEVPESSRARVGLDKLAANPTPARQAGE